MAFKFPYTLENPADIDSPYSSGSPSNRLAGTGLILEPGQIDQSRSGALKGGKVSMALRLLLDKRICGYRPHETYVSAKLDSLLHFDLEEYCEATKRVILAFSADVDGFLTANEVDSIPDEYVKKIAGISDALHRRAILNSNSAAGPRLKELSKYTVILTSKHPKPSKNNANDLVVVAGVPPENIIHGGDQAMDALLVRHGINTMLTKTIPGGVPMKKIQAWVRDKFWQLSDYHDKQYPNERPVYRGVK